MTGMKFGAAVHEMAVLMFNRAAAEEDKKQIAYMYFTHDARMVNDSIEEMQRRIDDLEQQLKGGNEG